MAVDGAPGVLLGPKSGQCRGGTHIPFGQSYGLVCGICRIDRRHIRAVAKMYEFGKEVRICCFVWGICYEFRAVYFRKPRSVFVSLFGRHDFFRYAVCDGVG